MLEGFSANAGTNTVPYIFTGLFLFFRFTEKAVYNHNLPLPVCCIILKKVVVNFIKK